jgi:hypothetical protein
MSAWAAILLYSALLSSSADQERRLRLEYDDVAAHADALIELADNLEASLREQGFAIHPEIASARNHLVAAMDAASDALARRDWKELRRHLERARGWVDRLRRKL